MIMFFTLSYYLLASILANNSKMPQTIEEDEELDVCPTENFNLPVSFSYNAVKMDKITLNVDVAGLEKLDFFQELSDSLKEQLVIYTLFFEKIIWWVYVTKGKVINDLEYILRNLERKDQDRKFAKTYEPLVKKGTHELLNDRLSNGYKIDKSITLCSFSRTENIIHVAQKNLSNKKYKELLEKIVSNYYEKRKYIKIFNSADFSTIDVRSGIRGTFKWYGIHVIPLGRRAGLSKLALDNLVNFFLFTFQDSIDKLPDYIFDNPIGLPIFLYQ
ncbi:hypothetical protein NBO_7g0006 [Nosema bombycis CQ1]|uniref:Uncharacterized protein n=1 Tax=Nosema bombycis (strain CQ1 / CVCC 102059) TaxID=578461 RepID=R0MQM0_NOSB1|nr:hypothetical protein NBO_7g0006 [Nosema bombycis CQ1]|eukprot:EOB15188.1 hypothetical protein NBO_7g0006 [Nosema bombycis CQ1]